MCDLPKILIVFTGGTIGSVAIDGVKILQNDLASEFDENDADNFTLSKSFNEKHPNLVKFEIKQLEQKILSENMTIEAWNRIIALVKSIKFDNYEGVIITHGTDTLAYTASLLSVLLMHVDKPVMLVSSNEPLSSPEACGHKNFEDAINFILSESDKTSGVFVPYSYDLSTTVIYLAKHITQSQPFINRFGSFKGIDFGIIEDGCLRINNADLEDKSCKASLCKQENVLDAVNKLDNCILMITPYVGLDYSCINLHDGIRAVLHCTYHSFSMCIGEKNNGDRSELANTSVEYFYEKCCEKDIPLYFSSFDNNLLPYETTKYMIDKGANFILDSSVELAYARLVIGHTIQQEKGVLNESLRNMLDLKLLEELEE